MRFGTRTFLLSSAPVAALLIAAFYLVENLTVSALTEDAKRSLRQSQLAMARSRSRSEAESARLLRIVSENAPLKAAMQLVALDPHSEDAKRTLEDQLREICAELDLGFLSAFDPAGGFTAGVIRRSGAWIELQSQAPPPRPGFYETNGDVFNVTTNRVTQAGEDLGQLSVGRSFDLGEIETPAILLLGHRIVLSSISGVSASDIERALSACSARQDCQLRLANGNFLFTVLEGSWSGNGWALISLQNLDSAVGPAAAHLRRVFLLAGLSALGLALLGSLLSARAIVQPLATIVGRLRASEQSGLLGELRLGPGAVKEIRELAESFNHAASAIRKSKEDLQRAYLEFTGSLASALDARDSYTAGHSHRVSEYSCAIAERLRLSTEEVREIRIGALLHDIGKIGIADSVLQKPGKLTKEEFSLIQLHPTIGRHILEGVNGFQPYLGIVELHHENWDGTGYPHGLSGENVPLGARIVHVADAFDAMTSNRPYRRGTSVSEAFSILNRFSGTQFDPTIVTAFQSLGLATEGLMPLLESVSEEQPVAESKPA